MKKKILSKYVYGIASRVPIWQLADLKQSHLQSILYFQKRSLVFIYTFSLTLHIIYKLIS